MRGHKCPLPELELEPGAAPSPDRAQHRSGEDDRLVTDDDRQPAAFDHDPVVDVATGAYAHVADDRGGGSDSRLGCDFGCLAISSYQHHVTSIEYATGIGCVSPIIYSHGRVRHGPRETLSG